MSETGSDASKPLLFISHRHTDNRLANVFREWVETWGRNDVEVFQSSAFGAAPQIGANLSDELLAKLYEAQAVVLVYTARDEDWSYCMWECGVATDPTNPDTRLVVLQCMGDVPGPFQNKVRVNARDAVSVQNFASNFLTDPQFFPRYGQAVAPNLEPKGQQVLKAADELVSALQEVLPQTDAEPSERWPSLPFVRFSVGLDCGREIREATVDRRSEFARKTLLEHCIVEESDAVAAKLFGLVTLQKGMRLQELVGVWQERESTLGEGWVDNLLEQMTAAACWRFPKVRWTLFKGSDNKWYSPLVIWVRKDPALNVLRVDVHFVPFTIESGRESFEIPLPEK